MATAKQVLAREAAEIGYSRWDDPEQGTKYGRWFAELVGSPWFGANGVAFCAMGQSYCFHAVGQKAPGLPTAGCGDVRRAALSAKRVVNKAAAKPGDLVLFRWDKRTDDLSYSDHIGIVEANFGKSYQTIEFNTNGGRVARRVRSLDVVQLVVRPEYDGGTDSGSDSLPVKLQVDGIWGRATTLRIQEVLGAPYRDGEISRQNAAWKSISKGCGTGWQWVAGGEEPGSQTIKLIQQRIGATPDGFVGPNTWNRLIRYYQAASGATELDGRIDCPSITVKAMQRALNEGRF